MFHQVLSFKHFAELEFIEEQLSKFFVLDEVGEGEVIFEALEDKSLIAGCFFLDDFHEVFVDLVVVDGTESSQFL